MGSAIAVGAAGGGTFDAYLAAPASGRGPGVVLIQEIFGVNAFMRRTADWLAAEGFAAACPDLFWRQQPGVQLTDATDAEWQKALAFMKGMDETLAIADIAATLDRLRAHPACTGKAGAMGFCMGGRLAYLLACRQRPDACVAYYGVGIERLLAEARALRAPLMLHIAGKDSHCPPAAQAAIHQALDGQRLATLHDYPDQDHAFARAGGRNHDARAAELAHRRSLEFFARHLRD